MQISTVSKCSLTLIIATMLWNCQPPDPPQKQAPVIPARDGVFVHISHGANEPNRALMGLRMASVMSADKDVLVYFDIQGVEMVLKDNGDLSLEPFESAKTQLQTLLDDGVKIYVCPSCLAAAGKTSEEVMEGVQIANKEAFFDFTNGRILTLDY